MKEYRLDMEQKEYLLWIQDGLESGELDMSEGATPSVDDVMGWIDEILVLGKYTELDRLWLNDLNRGTVFTVHHRKSPI